VDLRGHGQSDKPEGSYAMGVFADEAQPRSDMSRFHEMFPNILYGKTVGSGHFCQLEVPERVGAMIDCFLTIALLR
jgi:hypothetical protein